MIGGCRIWKKEDDGCETLQMYPLSGLVEGCCGNALPNAFTEQTIR